MTRFNITHACGCDETVSIDGRNRHWLAARMREEDCWECKCKEQSERAGAAAAEAGLPTLAGSEKQVAWALTIRDGFITRAERIAELGDENGEAAARLLPYLRAITDAHWWIDNREETLWFQGVRGPFEEAVARQADSYSEALATIRGEDVPDDAAAVDAKVKFQASRTSDVTLPLARRVRVVKERWHIRLENSRWEGCTFDVPEWCISKEDDESFTLEVRSDWVYEIRQDRRYLIVSAWDLFEDLTNPREQAEYTLPTVFHKKAEYNRVDVPAADVEWREKSVKVTMRNSRWEGLHTFLPVYRAKPYGDVVELTVRRGYPLTMRGGEKPFEVSVEEFWEDRAHPLEEPGEDQSVEQLDWQRVTVHLSHLTRMPAREGKGASVMLRWPWHAGDRACAVTFHPIKLVHRDKDDEELYTLSFLPDWEFKVRGRDGEVEILSGEEFRDALSGWSDSYRRQAKDATLTPETVAPIEDVEIPEELRDVA